MVKGQVLHKPAKEKLGGTALHLKITSKNFFFPKMFWEIISQKISNKQ
jgi:hypothetical protein